MSAKKRRFKRNAKRFEKMIRQMASQYVGPVRMPMKSNKHKLLACIKAVGMKYARKGQKEQVWLLFGREEDIS